VSTGELKFLVDVGVGKKVEEYLLEKGYDIKAVRSLDQRMPDQEIECSVKASYPLYFVRTK